MRRPTFLSEVPARLIVTGIGWLLLGAYLATAGTAKWLEEPRDRYLLVSPAVGLLSLIAGFGLIARKAFTRGVVVFLAGLGLLYGIVGSWVLAQPMLRSGAWLARTVIAAMSLFFAWSIVVVSWRWPHRPARAAG